MESPATSALPPIVLAFAATDPSGGAGLQADLLTLAALGCHPLTVVTALTAQDTRGVEGLLPIAPEWILRQGRVLLADIGVSAIKIGVTASAIGTNNASTFPHPLSLARGLVIPGPPVR